jgi:hypothetical protein
MGIAGGAAEDLVLVDIKACGGMSKQHLELQELLIKINLRATNDQVLTQQMINAVHPSELC